MGKINILAKSNLKTSKGASICVGVLLFVASILLNISLILLTDYKDNFFVKHDETNAEHVCIQTQTTDGNFYNFVSDNLNNNSDVSEYEITETFSTTFHIPFNGGNYSNPGVFFKYSNALNKKIGKVEFIGDILEGEGIYLPYLFETNGYKLGDVVPVGFGDNEENDYKVLGFYNSMMIGSNNCSMTGAVLSDNLYEKVKSEISSEYLGYFTSIRLKDIDKSESFEGNFTELITTNIETNGIYSNNVSLVSNTRYITQKISSAIILVISAIICVIAVVISVANLTEYIKGNMKNIGALKAIGYTSFDIIYSFMLQFGIISIISTVTGVLISYIAFPFLNSMLLSQTGIPYQMKFVFKAGIITILIFVLSILTSILFSCLKIRKIEAIDALRDGITTHSFKKNLFNLDKKGFSLNISLGLKTMIGNIRGNITALITSLVLSFVLIFNVFLLFNSIISFDPMVKFICAITPDGIVYIDEKYENDLIEDLKENEYIKEYYFCSEVDVNIKDTPIKTQIAEAEYVEDDLIVIGKAPIYSNEIAIGAKFAKENNIKIGDTIDVSLNKTRKSMIVSGFTQNSNYLGKDALLSRDGFKQFDALCQITYNIHVSDLDKLDGILEMFETKYNAEVVNYIKETQSFTKVYQSLIQIVFYIIVVITILVVSFVLFLLVRNLLDKKKKEYGILKALGFETKDLIKQTMISFVPMLVIGATIGGFMGYFLMNKLLTLGFSAIGIVKCNLEIPVYSVFICIIALVAVSLAIVFLQALKIKKIDTYKLLIGE